MGCNCKQVKKIEKKYPSFFMPKYEKKGLMNFMSIIKEYLVKLFKNLIIIILILIGVPFVAFMVIINYIQHGELFLKMPFLKTHKLYKNERT